MKVINRLFNKMVRRFEGLVFRKLIARSGEKYKINDLQYYVAIFVCYNYTMICKIDSIIGISSW